MKYQDLHYLLHAKKLCDSVQYHLCIVGGGLVLLM